MNSHDQEGAGDWTVEKLAGRLVIDDSLLPPH